VALSSDGGQSWWAAAQRGGESNPWTPLEVDLTPFIIAGESQVSLRLILEPDAPEDRWQVDDVAVEAVLPPERFSAPFFDDVEGWRRWEATGAWEPVTGTVRSGLWAWQGTGDDATLTLGRPLALTETVAPRLSFWYTGGAAGNGWVEVSADDGQSWTTVYALTAANDGWTLATADLGAYAGELITLRFRLGESEANWTIDDVAVYDAPPAYSLPFADDMEVEGNWWTVGEWEPVTATAYSAVTSWRGYSEDASLILERQLHLTGTVTPTLIFWQRCDLPAGYAGYVKASADGGLIWEDLYAQTSSLGEWTKTTVDLSAYAGEEIRLVFYLTGPLTATVAPEQGWFIDDVYVAGPTPPPLVQAGPDVAADEGETVAFSGVYTGAMVSTVRWRFGDGSTLLTTGGSTLLTTGGSTADGTLTTTHVYADDGVYPVTLTVTDVTGLSASDGLTTSVANVAPAVGATAVPTTAQVGQAITFTATFTDPGVADTHTITWTFGDTSPPRAGGTVTHTYTASGVYTVTLTIADDDDGVGSDVLLVVVHEAAPGLICESLSEPVNYVDNGYAPTCSGITLEPQKLKLVDSDCNPIADARVNLRGENDAYITYVKTDADGIADFSAYGGSAVPSKFEVDYNGAGYATATGSYDVGAVVQTRAYQLQLIGSDCSPVENARVNLRKANDAYVTYVRTDSDGLAAFQVLPEAQMKLEVDYNGARWNSEAHTPNIDVVLGAEAFRLSLLDSAGFPLENARVNLRKADDAYVTYARTDAAGLAWFDVVPEGALKLEVDYNGARYATPASTSHAPETVQTRAFSLLLTDSHGDPVENARVNLRQSNDAYVTYARTDGNGVAAFEVVPGAQMKLEVDYNGATYSTLTTEVTDDMQLEVQTRAFSLRLVDSTGQPIADARVNLRKSNDAYVTYTRTDGNGIATFEVVPDAQMKLEVDYNGATYSTPTTEVTDDTQLEVQTRAFSLRLTDSTGQPIENARVNLRKSNDAYVTYTRTGSNGVATFEVVPDAQMKLEVDYNGATYSTPTTEVTEDTQLEVQTVPLTVHITVGGTDLADQRVDLLKSNDACVTYTRTGADGRATFEVLPDAQHKLRSTYSDDVWISDLVTGPIEVEHDFN
jgi:PKD repeat protein